MARSFLPEPLGRAVLAELLDLARHAPSAGNAQGAGFLALDEKKALKQFWDISLLPKNRQNFAWQGLLSAPAIILPIAQPELYVSRYQEPDKQAGSVHNDPRKWRVPYWLTDSAFAVQNLLLAAHARSIGALFFGIFAREEEIKSAFKIPEAAELLGAVALGHIDHSSERPSNSTRRSRRQFEDVVCFNLWGTGKVE